MDGEIIVMGVIGLLEDMVVVAGWRLGLAQGWHKGGGLLVAQGGWRVVGGI
jgi:hypothetical protein